MEDEAALRQKTELARIEAEAKAKGRVDRENRDLNLEQIKLKATERRKTILDSIQFRSFNLICHELILNILLKCVF